MIYLLVITMWINGQQMVDVERFSTMGECQAAMQVVYQTVPNISAQCHAVQRPFDADMQTESAE